MIVDAALSQERQRCAQWCTSDPARRRTGQRENIWAQKAGRNHRASAALSRAAWVPSTPNPAGPGIPAGVARNCRGGASQWPKWPADRSLPSRGAKQRQQLRQWRNGASRRRGVGNVVEAPQGAYVHLLPGAGPDQGPGSGIPAAARATQSPAARAGLAQTAPTLPAEASSGTEASRPCYGH